LVFLAIAPRGVTGASREKFWDGKYDTWVMRFVRGAGRLTPRETKFVKALIDSGVMSFGVAAQLEETQEKLRTESGVLKPVWDLAVEGGLVTAEQSRSALHAIGDGDPASVSRTAVAGGRMLGGYELISKLGQGGMGAVYKARQTTMDRLVALKVLPKNLARNEAFIQRFLREARAAGKLQHPNIVAGIDAGCADGYYYLAMEYVEGRSLGDRLRDDGPLDEREAAVLGRQIAEALDHAHDSGLVHRDIKPENVLLASGGQAKVCDLGLARGGGEDMRLTQTGLAVGTPHYIAPEQARGQEPDCRSDIYSLGCTLYHALAGQTPFEGSNAMAVMQKHLNDAVPRLATVRPGISQAMEAVLDRMMAKAPEERYQTAAEAAEDLGRVIAGERPKALNAAGTGRRPGTTVVTSSLRPASGRRGTGRQTTRATRPVTAVGARRLLPVLLAAGGVLILGAAALLLWATYWIGQTKMPGPGEIVVLPPEPEDPRSVLAVRFEEARSIEAADPGQYDRLVSLYRSLARDAVGTEFEAKAKEAIAALEGRRRADRSAERQKALAAAFDRLRRDEEAAPENFAELIGGYERLAAEAAGTDYETRARQAAEALSQRRTVRADELFAALRGRVEVARDAGRFAAALEEIASFPKPFAGFAEKELAALREGVLAAGEARWQAVLDRARKLAAEDRFEEAAAALAGGRSLGLPGLEAKVAAALGEVAAARTARTAARESDSEKACGEFAAGFAGLLKAGDYPGIAALGRKVSPRLLPEHAARVRADLDLAGGAEAFLKRLRVRLTGWPAGELSVHLPMGAASFQKYGPETDKLTVRLHAAGSAAVIDFELTKIDRAELVNMSRRCAERAGGGFAPAEALEAACFLLAGGQVEGVKGFLDAARAGGLDASDLATRLDALGKGVREVEAERLLAEFDRLCQGVGGAAVVNAGERLLKDYGDAAAVKARAEELAGLIEKARPKDVPATPGVLGTIAFRQGAPVPALRIESYAGTSDTTLSRADPALAGPERGQGGAKSLTVVVNKEGKEARSVIRFDLRGIPVTAKVQKAVLRMIPRSRAAGMTVGAYRVAGSWEASEKEMQWDAGASWTWACRSGKTRVPWKTPGGDFDSSTDWGQGPNGLLCKPASHDDQQVELDITVLAQAWIGGRLPNFGILLKPETPNAGGNWAGFESSEADEIGKRPVLELVLARP
jgi:serine/threonine-protein kinase